MVSKGLARMRPPFSRRNRILRIVALTAAFVVVAFNLAGLPSFWETSRLVTVSVLLNSLVIGGVTALWHTSERGGLAHGVVHAVYWKAILAYLVAHPEGVTRAELARNLGVLPRNVHRCVERAKTVLGPSTVEIRIERRRGGQRLYVYRLTVEGRYAAREVVSTSGWESAMGSVRRDPDGGRDGPWAH
jgi:hypothetical protein